VSESRKNARRRGVWQRRFHEHLICDEQDFCSHVNYIHYNPVKHAVAHCPHAWPYSTFHKWIERGFYRNDWMCVCNGANRAPPTFEEFKGRDME